MNRSLNNLFIRKLQQGAANRWRINSPFVSRTKLLGCREVKRHFHQQRVDTGYDKGTEPKQYTNRPTLPKTSLVGRSLPELNIHTTLQEETDEDYNIVHVVSADHINSGKKFVAKAFLCDENGNNELFENEYKVYNKLMSQSKNAELWPKLIEYGTLNIQGCVYYYLATEFLEGEEASQKECEECARSLQKLYGLVHNDVSPSNFIRLVADNEGKRVVKALDFEHSYFAPISTNSEPSGQSKSANISIVSGLVGFCSATILFMVARLFDLF